jgi:hypothetical protein
VDDCISLREFVDRAPAKLRGGRFVTSRGGSDTIRRDSEFVKVGLAPGHGSELVGGGRETLTPALEGQQDSVVSRGRLHAAEKRADEGTDLRVKVPRSQFVARHE